MAFQSIKKYSSLSRNKHQIELTLEPKLTSISIFFIKKCGKRALPSRFTDKDIAIPRSVPFFVYFNVLGSLSRSF